MSEQIEASSGDRETEEHQFFEKSCGRNFALVVEGRSIWVSREQLADLSEYFRAMFFGGFQESRSEANEVELPGKKADEVVELLRVIIAENYRFKPITRKIMQNKNPYMGSMVRRGGKKIPFDGVKGVSNFLPQNNI